ncbi:NfeD family protein [Aureliella helgolandensis]|uniref:Uncharacterized protein n=1 Tax=Aureliella helgolandensis TaxID=2527968 RepID=A0A518G560_9BACT|nr:NfeD family protein [Aureliella helgolandensis]QDV23679.1 hypothetical protein Q31a_19840 [Aureliella helgolandensis]
MHLGPNHEQKRSLVKPVNQLSALLKFIVTMGLSIALGLLGLAAPAQAQSVDDQGGVAPAAPEELRQGYVVPVDLPLIGQRDEQIRRQITQISDSHPGAEQRPVVVLQFRASTAQGAANADESGGLGTRGSQFERCLALARFLTSPEASRVRLIAYLSESVEGHAVLPVLACEEILAAPSAELGKAAIDEPLDATIEGAYRDVVARRATLPEAVVLSMLDARAEVYNVTLSDGTTQVATRDELAELRAAGEVQREETLWAGGALALYSGNQLRSRRWISRTVTDTTELMAALDLKGTLRTARQLPRQWRPVMLTLSGAMSNSRVSQVIRSVSEQVDQQQVNLLVVRLEPTECDFTTAARLASYIASQESETLYSLALVNGDVRGPIGLVATACDETVLMATATLGMDAERPIVLSDSPAVQRELGDLASTSERPLPLLSLLVDRDVRVHEYIQQESGQRAIFADWQVALQADAQLWLAKDQVAGGEEIPKDIALRYRLIDSVDDSEAIALSRLGVDQMPRELKMPWLDASIEMILSQGWLPRLLLTIGFLALMAELGNPGIGVGGLLASVCFMGFFWIEGLNGNVEALEVLLFIGGLVALAIELFVIPGFGMFGIGGLLMLLISVVLASQTFIWPTTSAQLGEFAENLFWVACMALGGMIGLLVMHKQLERSPLLKWISLEPTVDSDLDELEDRESLAHREHLLGQSGLTTTRLNPSGKAQFGNDIVAVVGAGGMIAAGVPVRVVEVRGPLVIVTSLE